MSATELDARRGLQAAALCLDYPDEPWRARLPVLRQAATALPGLAGSQLTAFVAHAESTTTDALAQHYVEIFDLRRRCCLHLSYYSHGDTRKRGIALLTFANALRIAGFVAPDDELPDHLGVVCELAAHRPATGIRLLRDNRAAIELLHTALSEAGSPYENVTGLIRAVLPPASLRDIERARQLARQGPPAEEVGLEPFAPPEHAGARR